MTDKIYEYIQNKEYAKVREEIVKLNEVDIASALEELPIEDLVKIFRLIPKDTAAEVFAYLPIDEQQDLITKLTDKEAGVIINNLFSDDAADLLEEMPASVVKKMLLNTSPEQRKNINHLLQYPDKSAGSVMTVDFVDLKENITVAQAIDRIRSVGFDKETVDTCFVLDQNRKLLGRIDLRDLIISASDSIIGDIMEENFITTTTMTDQEEVAQLFSKYDLNLMPVTDSEGRLVGIITVDDIVDIMEQETTEDMEMMAAITPTDKPYMRTGILETFKSRIPWLLLLMLSSVFTTKIIQSFEDALAGTAILSAFIPMLMDTGGNAGGQSSVAIIRGLSLNEIEFSDILRIIWKEARVAVICGLVLACCNFIKMIILDGTTVMIASTVCLTLALTVLIAKVVGCTLPLLAKKIGFDPAVMASPFITTIVDAISLMLYFNIATVLLGI